MNSKWMDDALCTAPGTDPDIWFERSRRAEAVAACEQCPVAQQCSEHGGEMNAFRGVWGGQARRPKSPGPSTTADYLEARHGRRATA